MCRCFNWCITDSWVDGLDSRAEISIYIWQLVQINFCNQLTLTFTKSLCFCPPHQENLNPYLQWKVQTIQLLSDFRKWYIILFFIIHLNSLTVNVTYKEGGMDGFLSRLSETHNINAIHLKNAFLQFPLLSSSSVRHCTNSQLCRLCCPTINVEKSNYFLTSTH